MLPVRNLTFLGRLRAAQSLLTAVPLGYEKAAPDGGVAWPMFLDADQRVAQYGVYSTSFAVCLLSRSRRVRDGEVINAVTKGIEFLMAQYRQHVELVERGATQGKQATKKDELAHTDFDLVLKYALAIEAISTLVGLKDVHPTYNNSLADAGPVADRMVDELMTFVVSTNDRETGALLLGWPWHRIGAAPVADPIPTVHVLRTLHLPLFQGQAHRVDPAAIARQLAAFLADRRTRPVIMAFVINNLPDGETLRLNGAVVERIRARLKEDLRDETSAPWQETYHYDIISAGGRAHYKPWIWLSPKIELAQAMLSLGGSGIEDEVLEVVHGVVTNVERNKAFRVSAARPATLHGCWRAELFLREVERWYGG
jgi:hypothetical protein